MPLAPEADRFHSGTARSGPTMMLRKYAIRAQWVQCCTIMAKLKAAWIKVKTAKPEISRRGHLVPQGAGAACCAGIVRTSDFLDMSDEDFDDVIDTNLKGVFIVSPTSRPSSSP